MNEATTHVHDDTSPTTGPADKVIVRVSHRFDASAERVYDAFLDPERAGKFLFATPTGRIARCEIDARVGGAFTIARSRSSSPDSRSCSRFCVSPLNVTSGCWPQ